MLGDAFSVSHIEAYSQQAHVSTPRWSDLCPVIYYPQQLLGQTWAPVSGWFNFVLGNLELGRLRWKITLGKDWWWNPDKLKPSVKRDGNKIMWVKIWGKKRTSAERSGQRGMKYSLSGAHPQLSVPSCPVVSNITFSWTSVLPHIFELAWLNGPQPWAGTAALISKITFTIYDSFNSKLRVTPPFSFELCFL